MHVAGASCCLEGRNAELSVNAKTVDGTARVHAASC